MNISYFCSTSRVCDRRGKLYPTKLNGAATDSTFSWVVERKTQFPFSSNSIKPNRSHYTITNM